MSHPSIKDIDQQLDHVAFMLYGRPGYGKTRLVSTTPGRCLIVKPPADHTLSAVNGSTCKVWEVQTWNEMTDVYEYLRHGDEKFDWVWLDSLSVWQDYGLDDVWDDVLQRRPDRRGQNPDKGEYGMNMNRIKVWIRDMIGMGKFHFGVTCHPREQEDDDGNIILRPYIQGQGMVSTICGYMNVMGLLVLDTEFTDRGRVKSQKHLLHTQATERYDAKELYHALPSTMENPTMPEIMKRISATGKLAGSKTRTRPRAIPPARRRRRSAA
jgi:hypothetical protein